MTNVQEVVVREKVELPALAALSFVTSLQPYHLPLLARCTESFWNGTSAETLAVQRERGQSSFWETKDRAALVITETYWQPAGGELFVVAVAGTGILVAADDIISDLKLIARTLGCRWIGGMGIPQGWERPAKTHGFRRAATYYLLDLELN